MKRTAIALALVAALAGASLVQAHFRTYATNLTISFEGGPQGDSMSGKLSSPKPGCRRNRVVVYRVRPGDDQPYATDATDSFGRWAITPTGGSKFFPKGDYYAVAPRKRLGVRTASHRHRCARVKTSAVSVG